MNIADLREEYSRQVLDEGAVEKDPFLQFQKWFKEALDAKSKEANAMTLSTVSADGQPHGRIVLLKGLENGAFLFFTNYLSQKGLELAANNKASLTFFWAELERQVRVEGEVTKVDEQASADYFHSRPRGSQIGAWVSEQSTTIPNRAFLEEKLETYKARFDGLDKVPKPDYWGGYQLAPSSVEFWQGRASRLHDRIRYRKNGDNSWTRERLSP
jgi:pyridoxamine 5'-phosphate oxidase